MYAERGSLHKLPAAALTLRLPSARTAPSTARHAVRGVLAQWAALDDVLLVVSELVTNSVEHGASPIVLRVTHRDSRVNVSVFDSSPMPPRWTTTADDEGGRGLFLITAVATAYGHHRTRTGKATWAIVQLH